jgi:hypothetical protein
MNTRLFAGTCLLLALTIGGADYARAAEGDSAGEGEGGGGKNFDMPPFSIRLDPFNWLIEGRLGLELEVGVWKFISFELVPVFVVSDSPPIFNFAGEPDPLRQASNGLGPISGASFGLGFWLNGKPLDNGYVLRLIFTNYGYKYETKDGSATIDKVTFTERRLFGMLGTHDKLIGPLTLAAGIGIGVELNQQQRCFVRSPDDSSPPKVFTRGCKERGEDEDEQLIKVNHDASRVYDINGWLHPVYLAGRISLGVTFDP